MNLAVKGIMSCLRVMIVEKNQIYLENTMRSLRYAGFNDVLTAHDNAVASFIIQRAACDIVFLDYDNDNTAFLQLLAREAHRGALIVACTLDRRAMTGRRADAKGIDLFISKTATPANVALAMTALVTGPAARRGKVILLPSALRRSRAVAQPALGL